MIGLHLWASMQPGRVHPELLSVKRAHAIFQAEVTTGQSSLYKNLGCTHRVCKLVSPQAMWNNTVATVRYGHNSPKGYCRKRADTRVPMSIEFANPPINEVVVSTYFSPQLSDFRSEHVGLFWDKIRKDFPVARQQPPIASSVSVGLEVNAEEPFPMPRYWFVADDDISLIQIQKNAFMFNWRRRDDAYPRFHENIKPSFDKNYGIFSEFVRTEIQDEEPAIDLCELTYINAVERCEFWDGPEDTKNIFPSFPLFSLGIEVIGFSEFNCNYSYRIEADMQLNIGIRNGIMARQADAPVLIFEIRASARLGQAKKSEADEWFERAHDSIVQSFVGMTHRDIQDKYWRRVEEMP
ncbi:MAG: TIGR04255 family protein [Caldilineaceae bacterium]|nr:TIGR04255 family protein [Caldilineaceae bacterium]